MLSRRVLWMILLLGYLLVGIPATLAQEAQFGLNDEDYELLTSANAQTAEAESFIYTFAIELETVGLDGFAEATNTDDTLDTGLFGDTALSITGDGAFANGDVEMALEGEADLDGDSADFEFQLVVVGDTLYVEAGADWLSQPLDNAAGGLLGSFPGVDAGEFTSLVDGLGTLRELLTPTFDAAAGAISAERLDDTTIGGEDTARFELNTDLGQLASSEAFARLALAFAANEDIDLDDVSNATIDKLIERLGAAFTGSTVEIRQEIALDDNYVNRTRIKFEFELDDVTVNFAFEVRLSRFDDVPAIESPLETEEETVSEAEIEAPIPEDALTRYADLESSVTDEGFPQLGDPDAPVVVVQYSSFACTHCADFTTEASETILDYVRDGDVLFIYVPMYVPNNTSSDGQAAAEAAVCAGEQGAFWQYHDALFEWVLDYGEEAFTADRLSAGIANLDLDVDEFEKCLDSDVPGDVTQAAEAAAADVGIFNTPSVTVNDEFVDANLEAVDAAIRDALDTPEEQVEEPTEEQPEEQVNDTNEPLEIEASQSIAPDESVTVELVGGAGPIGLSLEIEETQTVTIIAQSENPGSIDTVVEILDADNNSLAFNDDHNSNRDDLTTRDSVIEGVELEAGTYLIIVNSFTGAASGNVIVTVEVGGEADNTVDNSIEEDAPDAIAFAGELTEAQTYTTTFDGTAGQVVTITVRDTSGTLDPIVALVDAGGNLLAENDDHDSEDTSIDIFDARIESFVLPADGTYTVQVTDYFGNPGAFEVTIAVTGEVIVAPEDGDAAVYEGTISENDSFEQTFTADQGIEVTITVQAADGGELDPVVKLIDQDGVVIASNDDHGTEDDALNTYDAQIAAFVLPESGTYTVLVEGYGTSSGDFTLTITFSD